MTSGFESVFNEVLADIEKQKQALVRLQEQTTEITGAARSPRRQVSAKVDARGDLVELAFHGQAWRSLPPTELASLIVDTVRSAKEDAHAQLWESMDGFMPGSSEITKIAQGEIDWADVFTEKALPGPLMEILNSMPEIRDPRGEGSGQ
jgi:hypothetical protein